MIICIVFLLIISLSSCQQHHVATQKDEKNIVVCFDHYHPKPYKTPGGIKHTLMPKALYTDNTEILKEYMPEADFDTITLFRFFLLQKNAIKCRCLFHINQIAE